jgi:hypothetical protein
MEFFHFSSSGNLLSFCVTGWSEDMMNVTSKSLLFRLNIFDVPVTDQARGKDSPDSKKVYDQYT